MYTKDLTIGILGGGQLGRMLLQSAIDLDLNIHILDPDPKAPCHRLTPDFTVGSLTDYDTVIQFGEKCDVISIEIENVNTEALQVLEDAGKKVFPQPNVIRLIQNKVEQKKFYEENDIPTSPFTVVSGKKEISELELQFPCVNKLAKEGYDGRGVQVLKSADDLDYAFDTYGLIEDFVAFEKEISVIAARNEQGQVKTFPVVEMAFEPKANLVEFLFSPADISREAEEKAQSIATKVINSLGMVGLLAVEMFLLPDGEILVNESAPRPHNSGHQTIEGNITSQFEQHLRSILNLPLGETNIVKPSAMVNVLGAEGHTGPAYYEGLEELLAKKDTHLHLYGKKLTKPFRKMGHVIVLDDDVSKLKESAHHIKSIIKVISK